MGSGSTFTDDQVFSLVVLERTGGSLSLFSVCLIFITYALCERVRTVPNTFIVFASVANAGASIASIIAYNGLWEGQTSALCQAQGFLFEMFVQSDPWWSLAMAINVLMVFFMNGDAHSIKKWGWVYCLICYGGPLIIALVCLQLRAPNKTLVYGSAGLWCWITNDWNPLRIYSYYMLIWFCILSSMFIYIGIGYYVFRARNRLNQFSNSISTQRNNTMVSHRDNKVHDWPASPSSGGIGDIYGSVNIVTEVRVTHSAHEPPSSFTGKPLSQPSGTHSPFSYSRPLPSVPTGISTNISSRAARPYPPPKDNIPAQTQRGIRRVVDRFRVLDPVKRAYLRTAFLFGLSVLVTWIPSSANRIRGLIYSDSPYAYNVGTATVLPLQGVWNAIIFFVTSWKVLRETFGEWRRRKGVVELTDGSKSGRTGAASQIWRDTDGGGNRKTRFDKGEKHEDAEGKDSWDFADLGAEGSGSDIELRGREERTI